ncbi:hypothetical protein BJ944DRAFT_104552 [Cunninghamella echinulata]|nr:hypothetical protein BJ944DRAFT_104552 [Cunninghamella echinulata]
MSDSRSFNDELFWLEQEDASSDNETFLPSDTPLDSPNIVKMKKRTIKISLHHVYNKTIQKQVNEFSILQKDFSTHIDSQFLSKKIRHKPIFELIDGSKFLDKNINNVKNLLLEMHNENKNSITTSTQDDYCDRQRTVNGDSEYVNNENQELTDITINEENRKKKYQNEILRMYNNLIKIYRSGHRNQLSDLQKEYNDRLLKVNDHVTLMHEEALRSVDQVFIPTSLVSLQSKKNVYFIDSSRDPRLKRLKQHSQLQPQPQLTYPLQLYQSPTRLPQQQEQPIDVNTSPSNIKVESMGSIMTPTTSNQLDISNMNPYQLNPPPSLSSSSPPSSSSLFYDSIYPTNNDDVYFEELSNCSNSSNNNNNTNSNNYIRKNLPSNPDDHYTISRPSAPSRLSSTYFDISRKSSSIHLQTAIKTLTGKYLTSRGEFEIVDGKLQCRISDKDQDSPGAIIELGDPYAYIMILELYVASRDYPDPTRCVQHALEGLKRNGYAVYCRRENNRAMFAYLPSLDKRTWVKVGYADNLMVVLHHFL